MRRGRMLAEDRPSELMKRYESDLLQQAVMHICRLDQRNAAISNSAAEKYKAELKKSEQLKFKSSGKPKNKPSIHIDELQGDLHILSSGDIENGHSRNPSWKKSSELNYSNFLQSLQKTFGFTWVIFVTFLRYPG